MSLYNAQRLILLMFKKQIYSYIFMEKNIFTIFKFFFFNDNYIICNLILDNLKHTHAHVYQY